MDAYLVFIASVVGAYYAVFITLQLAVNNAVSESHILELKEYTIMQKQQYEYQLKMDSELRKLKHDLSNHLGVIREFIYDGRLDDCKCYIDSLLVAKDACVTRYYTGDGFMDTLVKYYADLCQNNSIVFRLKGHLNSELNLELIDITTLIGNALQNAYEATIKAEKSEINIEIADHKNEIFIVISNTCRDIVEIEKNICKTSKSDKERHGFGFNNIKSVIEKYDGEYYAASSNHDGANWFNMTLVLPKGER